MNIDEDSRAYKIGYYGCAPAIVILIVVAVLYVCWHLGQWTGHV